MRIFEPLFINLIFEKTNLTIKKDAKSICKDPQYHILLENCKLK